MPPTTLNFLVDEARCTRCGLCVLDCPSRIITLEGVGLPHVKLEQEPACVHCQHCLAICPEAALSIDSFDPTHSHSLPEGSFPDLDTMDLFVRGRRSVRQYRGENVDPALVRRLLDALTYAPTGVNCRMLTFTLVQDKGVMADLRERVLEALGRALDAGRIPENAVSRLAQMVEAWREEKRDIIFRGAPHLLVISAPPDTPTPQQDVPLTLAYFELLAQSAGLGTVWCGLLKRVLEVLPELKPLLGLPDGHIYYAMLFGIPAVHYPRTVQREGTARLREIAEFPA
jgi:nitroreductase/NAD-dependent dihydropyrimidine dehydrogenase PreA subunit